MDVTSLGLLIYRVFFAALLIPHAIPKFSSKSRSQLKQAMSQMGLGALLDIGGLVETLGGIAILLGFLWIVASWILVIFGIDITIIARAKFKKPFLTLTQPGFDFELFYLASAILFVFTGPGVFSLDHLLSIPSTVWSV
jgi:putative oxidoreductase